jgi:hypothetical protein
VAKVNGARRDRGPDERGQLILVAGIALAILFVALALLVNAAIYTDNLATRGGDSAAEPLAYQAGVVDSVGGLIDAENAAGNDFSTIRDNVVDGVVVVDDTLRRYHLRRGARTNTTADSTSADRGLLIRETETTFTGWSANASAVRGFVIDLDTDNMPEDSPFRIDLDGTEVRVEKTGGEIVVSGGTESITCDVGSGGDVRFDVTGERLGDEPCKFGWPTLDSTSEIGLVDGGNGTGSYELTIESGDSISWFPTEADVTEALYSVDLDIRVDAPRLSYETTVRIAPGEPDV